MGLFNGIGSILDAVFKKGGVVKRGKKGPKGGKKRC